MRKITLQKIVDEVNNEMKLSLASRIRKIEYIEARAIYYSIAHEYTNHTLTHISKFIFKNHSTIIHSLRSYKYQFSKQPDFIEKRNRVLISLGILEPVKEPGPRPDLLAFKELVSELNESQIAYLSNLVKIKIKDWNIENQQLKK